MINDLKSRDRLILELFSFQVKNKPVDVQKCLYIYFWVIDMGVKNKFILF